MNALVLRLAIGRGQNERMIEDRPSNSRTAMRRMPVLSHGRLSGERMPNSRSLVEDLEGKVRDD